MESILFCFVFKLLCTKTTFFFFFFTTKDDLNGGSLDKRGLFCFSFVLHLSKKLGYL